MLECETEWLELLIRAKKAAETLIEKLKTQSCTLTLAESCTAGLISGLLAEIPGASAVLWGSFVCYTQEAKVSMLGLDNEELEINGLVSEKTALSMALGALKKSGAYFAAAVTGLAGPQGDGSAVPVGTVWAATARRNGSTAASEFHFTGSRNIIRIRAVIAVLETVLKELDIN